MDNNKVIQWIRCVSRKGAVALREEERGGMGGAEEEEEKYMCRKEREWEGGKEVI